MSRMRKYGESKTTRIMMATAPQDISGSDLENFRPMDLFSTECTVIIELEAHIREGEAASLQPQNTPETTRTKI